MADLKKNLTFFVGIMPDGSNDTVKVAFLTDNVSFVPAGAGSGGFLSSLLKQAPDDVDISSLGCSLGIDAVHSSYNSILKILTVKFNNTGTAGTSVLMYGTALYN